MKLPPSLCFSLVVNPIAQKLFPILRVFRGITEVLQLSMTTSRVSLLLDMIAPSAV